MAIAWVESGGTFDPGLINMTGGDLARGGSYGLVQMSLRTAKDLGYTGAGLDLCKPEVCTALAAELFVRNKKDLETANVLADFSRLAAAYNCGTHHVIEATIPDSTLKYVTLAVSHMEHYAVQYGSENVCAAPIVVEAQSETLTSQIEPDDFLGVV